MSAETEKIRQKLLKRRLIFVSVALSVLGLVYVYFYVTMSPKSPEEDLVQSTQFEQEGEVVIGVLAPLQGELAAYGQSIVRGTTLAANRINEEGGVLGKKLRILTGDTRSDPALAAELTRDFITRAKVPLIIGTASEQSALSAAGAASEGKTPLIYLGNGYLKTCSAKDSQERDPYIFSTGFTEHMSVEPFLIYLADKLRQKESRFRIYYFGTDDDDALKDNVFAQQTAESLGFKTVAEEIVDGRITDYFRKIRAIFKKDPDVLLVTTSRRASPGFLQQVAKLGVKAEMAVAGIKPFEKELIAPLGGALDEFYTVSGYAEDIDTPENVSFLEAWKKLYPNEEPSDIAVAGAYTAVLLAQAAFEKAGSSSTEAFLEAMKNLEVLAPQGRVSVNPHNNTLIKPLFATRFKNGRFVVDEYLGDVSHPSLEACVVQTREALE